MLCMHDSRRGNSDESVDMPGKDKKEDQGK